MKQEFEVTCPFCSVGCRFKILKGTNDVVFSKNTRDNLDYHYKQPINEGGLCPRGHFSYELLFHPKRMARGFYKYNGKLIPEIPEIIFRNIISELEVNEKKQPLAILFDPMISLHDIRALLDFASNNKVTSIDFISPVDRHLFRAMINNPFEILPLHDVRLLQKINYSLCIGDIFTKQPVLSRHLLKSKYALRKNALFSINTISSRTSWFANCHIENLPHTEPIHLFYLFKVIYENKQSDSKSNLFAILYKILKSSVEPIFQSFLRADDFDALSTIANSLLSNQNSAIFYSPNYSNAAGGYLTAILSAAIAQMINAYYVPLYTDSNLNALEDLTTQIFPHLQIGKKPILHKIIKKNFRYLFALGWNPETILPGNSGFPIDTKLIISSMVQSRFPENTQALLPQAHVYEQMDLRMNFQALQSTGSSEVKAPIGSAQSISHFIYQLHQKAAEKKVQFGQDTSLEKVPTWDEAFSSELVYYLEKLNKLYRQNGTWIIPIDHVAHYKDATLTQYSSWAVKDCIDETLILSEEIAEKKKIRNGQNFILKLNSDPINFKIQIKKKIAPDKLICYAHYLPIRKKIPGEFAPHNLEYYFWCPKINF